MAAVFVKYGGGYGKLTKTDAKKQALFTQANLIVTLVASDSMEGRQEVFFEAEMDEHKH